jgi:hypothetical protein
VEFSDGHPLALLVLLAVLGAIITLIVLGVTRWHRYLHRHL